MPTRVPGPIAAPEGLLAALGEYRQLHLALADSEPGHPWLAALERPTELDLDVLAGVESTLDATLSDLTLAVFASRVPHLEEMFELGLDGLVALAEEARAVGCPDDLLAIARVADAFVCVARHEQPWISTVVTPWHPFDGPQSPRPLQRWLKDGPVADLWDLLRELQAIDPDGDEPLPPQARADAAPVLSPRLVHARAAAAAAMRVQHAKFGEGRVLRSEGEGEARKLEIDFGPAGVRTILARFVSPIPTRP